MPRRPSYLSIERRKARPWAVISLVALLGAAACVIWLPNLATYLVVLGVAALAAARVVVILLEDRARLFGAGAVALVLAIAILTPWRAAEAERSGSPQWTLETHGVADNLYVDGDRMLFSDDDGLHAVNLADGKVVWSFDDIRRVGPVHVAADGHILIRSDEVEGDQAVWLAPNGKQLWKSVADEERRHFMGLNLRGPLASSNGVLVVRRCAEEVEGRNEACTYVGVGPDGKMRWEVPGYDGAMPQIERQEAASDYDDPIPLPSVVVVDSRPDDGGEARVIDARDGATVATVDLEGSFAVTGEVVVYQSGPAGDGLCHTHGLSRDRKVDWSVEAPCLGRSGVVVGHRIYGSVKQNPADESAGGRGRPIDDSFMIDAKTGTWKNVGGLEHFNNRVDDRVGVAGADVVVQRRDQRLTGTDPDTDDRLWELEAPGNSVPGVSSANGATVVLARAGRGHNPFYAGDDRGLTVLVIDSVTGDVTGRRTVPDIWNTLPAGPGQALFVDGEELSLIGADSD